MCAASTFRRPGGFLYLALVQSFAVDRSEVTPKACGRGGLRWAWLVTQSRASISWSEIVAIPELRPDCGNQFGIGKGFSQVARHADGGGSFYCIRRTAARHQNHRCSGRMFAHVLGY
jgi:hypothetical protein